MASPGSDAAGTGKENHFIALEILPDAGKGINLILGQFQSGTLGGLLQDDRSGSAHLGRLAGRIDRSHHGAVSTGQHLGKAGGEVAGARIEVGLEKHPQRTAPGRLAQRLQGGGKFGGMVGVIVVDADAARLSQQLQTALHALEMPQRK